VAIDPFTTYFSHVPNHERAKVVVPHITNHCNGGIMARLLILGRALDQTPVALRLHLQSQSQSVLAHRAGIM
jgi:hypothetical protein